MQNLMEDINFNFNGTSTFNYDFNNDINIEANLRNENNLLSKENQLLKIKNKEIEDKMILLKENLNDIDFIFQEKNKFKKTTNNNNLLIYKILNDVKDIYSLNNENIKLNSYYDTIKLNKLIFDNKLLKNMKEQAEMKKEEFKNKGNNLLIKYSSGLQLRKNTQEIIYKFKNIIEAYKSRNNFINNKEKAYIKIDSLLNQKQKLIEENINLINILNENNLKKEEDYKNNPQKEEMILLKNKNKELKIKLKKYNNIIQQINLSINKNNMNYKNKNSELNIDKKIILANKNSDTINKEIENTINFYKNEIKKKDDLINKLKTKYTILKKNELTSLDNLML
jgi:hypothetical protein